MIIDFHTHIFSRDVINNREKYIDDKNYSFLYSTGKAKLIDHNQMLESMNDCGIDYVVAMGFPWEKEKYCNEQNQYFQKALDLSEGRIVPFGSVPLNEKTDIDECFKK